MQFLKQCCIRFTFDYSWIDYFTFFRGHCKYKVNGRLVLFLLPYNKIAFLMKKKKTPQEFTFNKTKLSFFQTYFLSQIYSLSSSFIKKNIIFKNLFMYIISFWLWTTVQEDRPCTLSSLLLWEIDVHRCWINSLRFYG